MSPFRPNESASKTPPLKIKKLHPSERDEAGLLHGSTQIHLPRQASKTGNVRLTVAVRRALQGGVGISCQRGTLSAGAMLGRPSLSIGAAKNRFPVTGLWDYESV